MVDPARRARLVRDLEQDFLPDYAVQSMPSADKRSAYALEHIAFRVGKVDFGGIRKDINLAYTPEAEVGKYVLVHVGFAISVIDEDEAKRVFQYLEEMGGLKEELGEIPQ